MDTITANSILHTLDPVAFAIDLGFMPDPWQAQVLRWSAKRLIMNCSRQSGKSTVASLVALHRALFRPNSLILLIANAQRQSIELFTRVRYFRSKVLPRPVLVEDNKLSCVFANGSRIIALPDSEQTIRGYANVDLIVIDEASRVSDDLYFSVLPMLSVSNGRLILMSTPYGRRGFYHTEWQDGVGWQKVKVPATECPRLTPEVLEEQRRSMGDWWYQQEFMCEFMSSEANVFSWEDIERCLDPTIKPLLTEEEFYGYDA